MQKKVPLHSVFVTKEEKNVGKVKKSWRFRKKTMRLKCLIYRHAY